jgi:hypothetical protein
VPLALGNTLVTTDFVKYGGGSNYAGGWIMVLNGFVEVRLTHGPVLGQDADGPAYMLPAGVTPLQGGSRPDLITGFEIRALNGVLSTPDPQQFAAALWEPGLAGLTPTAPFPATISSSGVVNPCPCSGGGTTAVRKLLACWGGPLPIAPQVGLTWEVPFDSDGTSFTFTLARAFARIEATQSSSVQVSIESSPGGGTFTPTTVTTLTIGAGSFETTNTGIGVPISSGSLLRIDFGAVPGSTPQPNFDVEILGSQ